MSAFDPKRASNRTAYGFARGNHSPGDDPARTNRRTLFVTNEPANDVCCSPPAGYTAGRGLVNFLLLC